MKRFAALLTAIFLSLVMCAAYAGTSLESGKGGSTGSGTGINSELFNVCDFKFDIHSEGIGCGKCPVYTAPSENAYRAANGKASVDTKARTDAAGFENGWLLVRYETNSGYRVGYIPPSYVKGFKTSMEFKFSHIQQTAYDRIIVTDNPMDNNSALAYLDPGETYYILGKYTYYGNWWYIECIIDGQPARGFISRDTTRIDAGGGNIVTDLGNPSQSPSGSFQMGTVYVTRDNAMVRKNAGTDYDMVARVHLAEEYPAYGQKVASNGQTWYYIYVDGVWGWISSGVCTIYY